MVNYLSQYIEIKGCPSYEHYEHSNGTCRISRFKCSEISMCTPKRIAMECLLCKESNNTGNEAWLLANTILQEFMVNYENNTSY